MVKKDSKRSVGPARVLRENIRMDRRQICRFGAALGLTFVNFLTVQPRQALAIGKQFFERGAKTMDLSPPVLDGKMSLEKAVKKRRTLRSFKNAPITKHQFSQVLWAAQGITEDRGFKRAAPSGGALYPADVYAVVGNNGVENLDAGVFHYNPDEHSVRQMVKGDRRKAVAVASLKQMWMAEAPVMLVLTAEYARISVKYGQRGVRYALIEIGHIGQNVFLQCQALGLQAGIVGAFKDKDVAKAMVAQKNHEPLIILPIGRQG